MGDFDQSVGRAERRLRQERLFRVAGLSFRVIAALAAIALLLLLVLPRSVPALLVVSAVLAVGWLVVLVAAWMWPAGQAKAVRALDKHFGLPDHAVTASELVAGRDAGWLRLQYEDTLARLNRADWKALWPLRWPRFSGILGAAAAILVGLLGLRLLVFPPSAPAAPITPDLSAEAAGIEEMLKDWEEAAEVTKDPELKKLLAEMQPLREKLPEMNEREMLLALSELENKLESLRASAAKNSLEASAGEMAAALDGIDGLSGLSAAMRKKDFEKASELASKEAAKLGQPGAKAPPGAEGASQKLSQMAGKLAQSGNNQASDAMKQMGEGAGKGSPSEMGKGMEKLGQSLARAGQSRSAQAKLGLQLAQVGQCKEGMGQGEGLGRGLSLLPKLSQQPGGKGAGSATDPNRTKDPTESEAARTAENLTGMTSEGDSEVENLNSNDPGAEAPRAGRNAQFAQYEKLSQQAIADENLPLAYRETIRKYFETIRPASTP